MSAKRTLAFLEAEGARLMLELAEQLLEQSRRTSELQRDLDELNNRLDRLEAREAAPFTVPAGWAALITHEPPSTLQ